MVLLPIFLGVIIALQNIFTNYSYRLYLLKLLPAQNMTQKYLLALLSSVKSQFSAETKKILSSSVRDLQKLALMIYSRTGDMISLFIYYQICCFFSAVILPIVHPAIILSVRSISYFTAYLLITYLMIFYTYFLISFGYKQER